MGEQTTQLTQAAGKALDVGRQAGRQTYNPTTSSANNNPGQHIIRGINLLNNHSLLIATTQAHLLSLNHQHTTTTTNRSSTHHTTSATTTPATIRLPISGDTILNLTTTMSSHYTHRHLNKATRTYSTHSLNARSNTNVT